jgi:hypothetical protein
MRERERKAFTTLRQLLWGSSKSYSNGFLFSFLFHPTCQIFAVQHVDVCMFSNGKFKNIVAEVDVSRQIGPSDALHGVYSLLPVRGECWALPGNAEASG